MRNLTELEIQQALEIVREVANLSASPFEEKPDQVIETELQTVELVTKQVDLKVIRDATNLLTNLEIPTPDNGVQVGKVELCELVRDLLEAKNMVQEASMIRDRDEEYVSHPVALDCFDLLMSDPPKEVADQAEDVLKFKITVFGDGFIIHCSPMQFEALRKEAAAS